MQDKQTVEKICYACGFELNDFPYDPVSLMPNENVICPSCGIHYGYDDDGAGEIIPDDLAYSDWKFGDENHIKIMKFWRGDWIKNGMKWWSPQPIPNDWNPQKQLEKIPEDFS